MSMTSKIRQTVCPDVSMFVMMSKYVMRTKGSSLLQKVRHDVNKTSSRQKVCHDVKRFVMTSKIFQMFVMKSKIRHDVKKFVMMSKGLLW